MPLIKSTAISIDVIKDILETMIIEEPESVFIKSLYNQYCNRGGLSKKQMEGLHGRASKRAAVSASKLVTLEAIIKKKPTRYRSEISIPLIAEVKDEETETSIKEILAKYPQHKRLLYLDAKFQKDKKLTTEETAEVKKFAKILLTK